MQCISEVRVIFMITGIVTMMLFSACTTSPLSAPLVYSADSAEKNFTEWLEDFREEALDNGISASVFDRAFRGITPDPGVIKANNTQPEFIIPVWNYLERALSDTRIAQGKQKLRQHRSLLVELEKKFGVDRHVLVAIWGLETSYGHFMGSRPVIHSLASLASKGRRRSFATRQLMAALRILQEDNIHPEKMLGSWAGAMGHTQMIPTTYRAYAVDADGDGKRDVWESAADALASAANYLSRSGWARRGVWGFEVILPEDFDYALADRSLRRSLPDWKNLGLRRADGRRFPGSIPERDMWSAALVLPAGHQGPAFLVGKNFEAILQYNHSISYGLAVALLSERFGERGQVIADWPLHLRPLSRSERMELQQKLGRLGFGIQKVDGILGSQTRRAIRIFQKKNALPVDGFATSDLLERLRDAQ